MLPRSEIAVQRIALAMCGSLDALTHSSGVDGLGLGIDAERTIG